MATQTQDTDGETRWSHLKKVIAFAREHAEETGETVAAHMVGEIQKMMTGIEMDFPIGTGEAPAASPERERLEGIEALAYQAFVDVLDNSDGTIPVEDLRRRAHILVDDFAFHLLTPHAEPTSDSETESALLKALKHIARFPSMGDADFARLMRAIARTALPKAL